MGDAVIIASKSTHSTTTTLYFQLPPSFSQMTTSIAPYSSAFHPYKRRRTATTILAGDFDARPPRDVLTNLLNGVGPYKVVEKEEDTRRSKKKEKRDRDRERKRAKAAAKAREKAVWEMDATTTMGASSSKMPPPLPHASTSGTSSFWRARPAIHIATMHRSYSVTPPPMPLSPAAIASAASTPGPSSSSSTSRTSSKRPRTPNDDEDLGRRHTKLTISPKRKKRVAVKKGWKGWVEGSPPPSEKLINLDAVPVLQERRTRSGKSFDAIGVGKDGWV